MKRRLFLITLLILFISVVARPVPSFDVTWNGLSTDENSSMPLGNGDISANVWTEQNGDVVMLIGKSDSWSENILLYKVAQFRISLSPNPFVGEKVTQRLTISDARMEVKSPKGTLCIWVDANSPVVHISAGTVKPSTVSIRNEPWRTVDYHMTQEQLNQSMFNYWEWRSNPNGIDFLADTILPATANSIASCHFNKHSMYPTVLEREHLGELINKYHDPIWHRCFGAIVSGDGFVSKDNVVLVSSEPSALQQYANITMLTEQTTSTEEWHKDIQQLARQNDTTGNDARQRDAWNAHVTWWQQFWERSWVHVSQHS